jgi:hypothetical protein
VIIYAKRPGRLPSRCLALAVVVVALKHVLAGHEC